MRFKWHRRKAKDRLPHTPTARRPNSSLLAARRAIFLWAGALDRKLYDKVLIEPILSATEIAQKSAIDDFMAWKDWDGAVDKLPNYVIRQLIRTFTTYGNRSSAAGTPSSPEPIRLAPEASGDQSREG